MGKHNINIEENDYSQVENIVLPDLDGTTERKDIRIPLLSEYISICKKYDKICVLEVKNHFKEYDLKRLTEEIKATGYLTNVIFISFDFANCVNLRKLLPENTIQYLTYKKEITSELIDQLCENKIDIDTFYPELNPENIKLLHSKGIKVNCWTCDNKADAEMMISYGVDFITTNILE